MSGSEHQVNTKRLRQEVRQLMEDAHEHLPHEFHPRLRKVSEDFFEHRRKVSRLQQTLSEQINTANSLKKEADERSQQLAAVRTDLEGSQNRIRELSEELNRKQLQLDEAEEKHNRQVCELQQTQLSIRTHVDDLILRLGGVLLGETGFEISSVETSPVIGSRLSEGNLSDLQINTFIERSTGYFFAQAIPDDCVYRWYPLDLLAVVRRDAERPQSLNIKVVSASEEGTEACESAIKESGWWWLAINQSSCAASSVPISTMFTVKPTPEQLIGYRTQVEQAAAQDLLLNASMSEVRRYMHETIPEKLAKNEVTCMRLHNSEPPSEGPTRWIVRPPQTPNETSKL